MMLIWTTTATVLLVVSSGATFLTMLHLRFRWDVHASSVRWLFWLFFLFIWSWCSLRAVFFVWLASHDDEDLLDDNDTTHQWTYAQIDQLGVHGVLFLKETRRAWLVVLLGAGDMALLGVALTLFPLTYELVRLARTSMDRGVTKERIQTRRNSIAIAVVLLTYAIVVSAFSLHFGGYTQYNRRAMLGVYFVQFLALAYMVVQLVRLKVSGRQYETIHGTFVASPLYQRLKLIMLVYAFFAFQFQISTLIITFHTMESDDSVARAIGVSLLIYNASGLALAVTTSCSQACVFSTCAPCLPEDFEPRFLHQRFITTPDDDNLEAPRNIPVFVYTDIESSSALWNANGEMMGPAIEIHDNILRSSLRKYRGYEVTTVGDAFQIAFHKISDAVEYCMAVQLLLLVAKWPKDLHGTVPATETLRAGRRVIFNGLRVRMGIHDADETDGTMVQGIHVTTGKTTYSGVSEVIAEYVGDLGNGGQILVTGRVAGWLKQHRAELSMAVYLEYMGEYTIPQINANVTLYQVLPSILVHRKLHFSTLRTELLATLRQIRLSQRGTSFRLVWNTNTKANASSTEVESAVTSTEDESATSSGASRGQSLGSASSLSSENVAPERGQQQGLRAFQYQELRALQ